ncbi:MAG TPA: DUF975 family protein [Candidatus Paceibacterota bacterium]|nr:DUF975 family protein [Candidatus Paceibacterota bacterium]
MKLSVKECLSFGWETFKKRPWLLAGAVAVGVLVDGLTSLIERATHGSYILEPLGVLLAILISMLYATGQTNLFVKAHDDPMSARVADLLHLRAYWRFLCTSILLWLFIGLPYLALEFLSVPPVVMALLIIPALIVSLVFGFALYLVVDRGMGPLQSLKESAQITRGHRLELFLLLLAIVGVNLLGLAALVIGLFVSVPVTVLAMVHAYRMLSGTLPVAVAPAAGAV